MVDESSIAPWLRRLKKSDADAMQVIWNRFFESLVSYANRRLDGHPQLKGTGEDIAASVFESLWRGCREGRFQQVSTQSELWWTLLKMAKRKCISHTRRESAEKRGGNSPPVSLNNSDDNEQGLYRQLVSETPDPAYLVMITDEAKHCLSLLHDETRRRIAALSLEGHSTAEIAKAMDLSESTVRRKLDIVQEIWREYGNGDERQTVD